MVREKNAVHGHVYVFTEDELADILAREYRACKIQGDGRPAIRSLVTRFDLYDAFTRAHEKLTQSRYPEKPEQFATFSTSRT